MALFFTPVYAETLPPPVVVEPPKVTDECPIDRIECNCYLFVKSKIPSLPLSAQLVPNIPGPIGGSVAIFDYDGTPHYAVVTGIFESASTTLAHVEECNYEKGVCGARWIDINTYKPLKGFHLVVK